MQKTKFDISGMTCSSCSAHIEKVVKNLQGVESVNVNLLSNNMQVIYNEKIIDNKGIINAVVGIGYGASVFGNKKDKESKLNKVENNIKFMKKKLILSICFWIPLMYIAMHNMLPKIFVPQIIKNIFDGTENAIIFGFSQLLLLLPIIYLNRNYFIIGFKRLIKKSPNMDTLIAIGATASILYGIYAIFTIGFGLGHNNIELVQKYSNDIYFESAGTILTLITLGKYLEARSKGKTSDAIDKLINLVPKTAIVIKEEKEVEISIDEIKVGDIVIIKSGGSIPVDGIVIEGNSSVNQSSITGESIPVEKQVGDEVISGTINKNGYLKVRATKVGENTTLSQIIKLVEEASNSKAPISKLADRVSGIFVPIVIFIAFVATIIWILLGQGLEFAITAGIAVLVISCPCALGLATPVAIMVGTGKAAENGILVKSAESLELLHLIDTVVLDKTGTITKGRPTVTDIVSNVEQKELLQIAGSLEAKSEHPLSEAILERVKKESIEIKQIQEFENIVGRGIKGKIEGVQYICGNLSLMKDNNIETNYIQNKAEEFAKQGKTLLYLAKEKNLIGIIAVADVIKDTSYSAIKELKRKNIETVMLTGDNKVAAEAIGSKLKIDKVISEVLPQDKEKEIEKLQKQGKIVTFVGDGINDSPALVKANVGIAIGSGTDIAIESADIVLMKDNLLDVVTIITLSKAVIRNIKMNLFWAFFYNLIGIPIAAGVFYYSLGLKLNPMIGALAMSLSSVCVVTNALRLRKFKINYMEDKKVIENMKIIKIEGMQCNHCKMSVERVLNSIEGITDINVDLENKSATIKYVKEIEDEQIKSLIEKEGFKVISIEKN